MLQTLGRNFEPLVVCDAQSHVRPDGVKPKQECFETWGLRSYRLELRTPLWLVASLYGQGLANPASVYLTTEVVHTTVPELLNADIL